MLTNQTITKLEEMRLNAMAETYADQRADASALELSFDERFAMLVEREWLHQNNRALERRIAYAKLKQNASIEDLDWSAERGLNREVVNSLCGDEWIRHGRNVVITGATGVGKSWLACALGQKACRHGLKTLYVHTPQLFRQLFAASADGSLERYLRKMSRIDLLILDDWGLAQVKRGQYRDVLELLDRRQGKSQVITSQYPIETWYDVIDDPTVADAIIDRISCNAHQIELKGESMRRKHPIPPK